MLKIPFQFLWNIQNCVFFHQNNQFEAKTAGFADFSILTKIAVSGPITGMAIFLVDFFGWFFDMLKIPFQFFWNIQNCVLSSKLSVWSKNSRFCGLFNFEQNRCIRTLPAWPLFWLIFLVDFLKCWKYPSNSSATFKIVFFNQNNQFDAKTVCFADFSILTKIAVSGPYRRSHFFGWFYERLKIHFQFFWNIQNFVLSWKQSVLILNLVFLYFGQNRSMRSHENFGKIFDNLFKVSICLPQILPKHSKYCSLMKQISFRRERHVFVHSCILAKIAVSGDSRILGRFLITFLNFRYVLQILPKHSKYCSFMKQISFRWERHDFGHFCILD